MPRKTNPVQCCRWRHAGLLSLLVFALVTLTNSSSLRAVPQLTNEKADTETDLDKDAGTDPKVLETEKDANEANREETSPEGEKVAFDGPLDGLSAPKAEDDGAAANAIVKKKEEAGLTKPSPSKPVQKYYCHHIASCGIRPHPGPPTTDSRRDGISCVCRGISANGHDGMCFKGSCYNEEGGSPYRTESDLDSQGLCEYDVISQVGRAECDLKDEEKLDPKLKFFSDDIRFPKETSPIVQKLLKGAEKE